jgi:hypothetical protein
MLLLLNTGNWKQDLLMLSNSIIFYPSFVQVGQLVQKLQEAYTNKTHLPHKPNNPAKFQLRSLFPMESQRQWNVFCLLNPSVGCTACLSMKSLPCLWPGKSLQVLWCWFSGQVLIASLTKHLGILRAGSWPGSGVLDACRAGLWASSLPGMWRCPSTQMIVTSFGPDSAERAFRHSATSSEVTFGQQALLLLLSRVYLLYILQHL